MMKLLILILLGLVIISLGQGMFYLNRDEGDRDKTRVIKALTRRILLSLLLFALLIAGYLAGFLQPHTL